MRSPKRAASLPLVPLSTNSPSPSNEPTSRFKSLFRPRSNLALASINTNVSPPLPPPVFADAAPPPSPTILLSPSTPEFPEIDLPAEPMPERCQADERQQQHSFSLSESAGLPTLSKGDEGGDYFALRGRESEGTKMDKKLRHSLMLLDTRFAELESIAVNSPGGTTMIPVVEEPIAEEEIEHLAEEGESYGAVNYMLSGFATSTKRDPSMQSIASYASGTSTHSSSEDAFDIVDFPSIDQLAMTGNYELDSATPALEQERPKGPASPRDRSSDLMAFPIPPTDVPLIPLHSDSFTSDPSESANVTQEEQRVFEQLASLGQGEQMQGLGLFSSTSTSRPSSRVAHSETDADARSLCSNTSSSFEASTLASSCAPTLGFGRSTTSFKMPDREEMPTTSALYSRRANTGPLPMSSPAIVTSFASSTPGIPANALGSPFSLHQEFPPSPGTLSPYSYSDSPIMPPPSPTRSVSSIRLSSMPPPRPLGSPLSESGSPGSPMRRSSSRSELGFAEMHQASVGLLGLFDDGGIPMWQVRPEDEYSRNATPNNSTSRSRATSSQATGDDEEQEELLEEINLAASTTSRQPHSVDRPSPLRSFSSSNSLNPSSSSSTNSPMGALRRLSSFQILKKRKSENVLATMGSSSASNPPRPTLTKPKSEMALSTLAKQQRAAKLDERESNKENSNSTLPTSSSSSRLGRLSLRSMSSPRLSKLASPAPVVDQTAATPSTKPSPKAPTGFSARPRALSFNTPSTEEGNQSLSSTTSTKKRFSIFIPKQFGSPRDGSVPPVPPTPTEHLPAAMAAKAKGANIVIDVAKANGISEQPPIVTKATKSPVLEVSIPPLGDSESPTPSSAGFPMTPGSTTSAGQLPSASRDSEFTFPLPSPAGSTFSVPPLDDPISLATFLRCDTPEQIVNRPTRGSSVPQSSDAITPKQSSKGKGEDRSTSPLGDRTNWSRPTSPALLDALKTTSPLALNDLTFVPQQITIFPVRLPPPPPGALAAAEAEEDDEDEEEDDYGEDSDSDEDKPLGVVVPGALTAQKSLRKTISKKSRGEKKSKPSRRPKEDPFELEHAAAMVPTPPMSSDGHGSTSFSQPKPTRPPPSVVQNPLSASVIKGSQAMGHDSFLPQTDASIARKASSNGMRRSPSTPLDPMIANSALTIDSPVLTQEPLPMQQTTLPSTNVFPSRSRSDGGKRADLRVKTNNATSPPLSSQVPLRSPPLNGPPRSRPPPIPSPSYDNGSTSRRPSAADIQAAPPLNRRPSLHPDVAHTSSSFAMQRQPSSSSSKSSATSPSPLPSPSLVHRPTTTGRSRSGTLSAGPTIEHRVFVDKVGGSPVVVKVSDRTVAGEIVAFAKGKGALEGGKENDGGWALWEIWTSMGLERPIREYELVNDVLKTFEGDSAAFVFRRTPLWPILSSHARPQPSAPRHGPVQLEVKKGKWSKRFLELKDGTLSYSKSEKGKDATVLCQLSNFSVFYVDGPTTDRLKAPKPFVLALKSRLTRAHFEEVSQYCNFVSFKTAEERHGWMTTITEAGNAQLRQREQAILGVSSPPSLPTSPLLASTPPVPSTPFSLANAGPATTSSPSNGPSPRSFLTRNPSSRPAPAILSAPPATALPSPPQDGQLSRQPTMSKPDPRQWGSMSEQDRQVWLKHSEKKAKDSKVPLVDLSR